MYDENYFFVDNPLNRYSISARQPLKANADGSIDLLIQHESPGADKESNWLPAPKGKFILMMRLYWPNESNPSDYQQDVGPTTRQEGELSSFFETPEFARNLASGQRLLLGLPPLWAIWSGGPDHHRWSRSGITAGRRSKTNISRGARRAITT